MNKTVFHLEGMDCAAEEQLVRMRLEGRPGIRRLAFDLAERRLIVFHDGAADVVRTAVDTLGLGAQEVERASDVDEEALLLGSADTSERRPLWIVFGINAALFIGEVVAGLLVGSMGLIADSLDMLADAVVYGLSLAAVGASVARKNRVARQSGYFQLALAVFGLAEVARRFVSPTELPEPVTMIAVSLVALAGNVAGLRLISQARGAGAHVEASRIFTSNDVKVNLLVIAAGTAVALTASKVPDLVAGALIFVIVANGARRILALSK
jgi:Co/Zn/Cd efflux system component